jgi:hypothetical protein
MFVYELKKKSIAKLKIVIYMLQAGKSRVRFPMRPLDFSIDLNLPATPWPRDLLSP